MNTKNILITGLVGAVITLALTNIPFINFVNCLICAGFWVGPLFATWLYKRMSGSLTTKEGVWVGVTAGVIAGVIGFLLSFIGVAGMAGIVNQMNMFMSPEDQINMGGVEGVVGNILVTFFGVIFDIVVGAIGGLIGAAIFKDKTKRAPQV
ncbi:MAG: hypothetical protein C3F13_13715 [Anaerolineales bacterium]|nr:hypothetical protein [Anaerolineae bacterium]PWB51495.1 MAG: hypothetical protein C3F13_13715 [Anaerolineales bacterium]